MEPDELAGALTEEDKQALLASLAMLASSSKRLARYQKEELAVRKQALTTQKQILAELASFKRRFSTRR